MNEASTFVISVILLIKFHDFIFERNKKRKRNECRNRKDVETKINYWTSIIFKRQFRLSRILFFGCFN